MKKCRYLLTSLLLSLYVLPMHAFYLLPVSVDNQAWMGNNAPSLTLRVQNVADRSIQALYFPIYPEPYNYNSVIFFGKEYQILSSQFQYRNETINNFCGLQGRQISGDAMSITLEGQADNIANKDFSLSCQLHFERFSSI